METSIKVKGDKDEWERMSQVYSSYVIEREDYNRVAFLLLV